MQVAPREKARSAHQADDGVPISIGQSSYLLEPSPRGVLRSERVGCKTGNLRGICR
jgi:hypothetical protein